MNSYRINRSGPVVLRHSVYGRVSAVSFKCLKYCIWFRFLRLLQCLRSTQFCSRSSFNDITRINIRLLFGSFDHLCIAVCIFSPNLVEILLSNSKFLTYFEIQYGGRRRLGSSWLVDYARSAIIAVWSITQMLLRGHHMTCSQEIKSQGHRHARPKLDLEAWRRHHS